MNPQSIKKEYALEEAWLFKITEEKPITVFVLLFTISLIVGAILFILLQYSAPSWIPDFLTVPKTLDAGGAGGFLQGAWGTAGSLAASFVAIVLARQALKLTEKQEKDQEKNDEELKNIQIEQNEILMGTNERKKFRNRKKQATINDVLENHQSTFDSEIKNKLNELLLKTQFINLNAEIAEKLSGPEARLHFEMVAGDLITTSHPTLEKILINELIQLSHQQVEEAINSIKEEAKKIEALGLSLKPDYIKYK